MLSGSGCITSTLWGSVCTPSGSLVCLFFLLRKWDDCPAFSRGGCSTGICLYVVFMPRFVLRWYATSSTNSGSESGTISKCLGGIMDEIFSKQGLGVMWSGGGVYVIWVCDLCWPFNVVHSLVSVHVLLYALNDMWGPASSAVSIIMFSFLQLRSIMCLMSQSVELVSCTLSCVCCICITAIQNTQWARARCTVLHHCTPGYVEHIFLFIHRYHRHPCHPQTK